MSQGPNKLSQFWQELKRRKVVRVITVYAAAAFVILELLSIIIEPLRLPEWTLQFAIVFLCIGFIIAVILSWVYDIHPEGGIVKTEPAQKVIEDSVPPSSKGWRIASYISFVVIVGLIVLNVIPRSGKKVILDKSIAVLPFKSLSDDPDKQYLADGVMDAILLHLSKIEDLRVMSRTSVEQYRSTEKTARTICQELDVTYLLEGSFQKYGDQARLIVQLIEPGKEDHVWANEYDRNWKDIFTVQSEVAKTIAMELQAVVTRDEISLIEKIPTADLIAYDLYQKGNQEYNKYVFEDDSSGLERAEVNYFQALKYDSTFAQAYVGLANVYSSKYYWDTYFSEDFKDSARILADIALSYDPQLEDAYLIKGSYFSSQNLLIDALEEYNKALTINPNSYKAYTHKAFLFKTNHDFVKAIKSYFKAIELNRGPNLPGMLGTISDFLYSMGFTELGHYYSQESLRLDGDSMRYFIRQAHAEGHHLGNYEKAIEVINKARQDESHLVHWLGYYNMFLHQYEEALKYFTIYIDNLIAQGIFDVDGMHRFGFVYWKNGYIKEGEQYFSKQIEYCNRVNELEREYAQKLYSYYDLAGVYAFTGEKEKAYENLRLFNQGQAYPILIVTLIQNDPLFESIRDEPAFQEIVRDVEAKYQAEHERVRQWLEANDML